MAEYGREIEDAVAFLCERTFLSDFVCHSPKFRKPGGKELEAADFLLLGIDNLVSVQVRSRQVKLDGDRETEVGRIRSAAQKAVSQTKTIRRALERGMITEAVTLRGIKVPLRWSGAESITGIVILDVLDESGASAAQHVGLYGAVDREVGITVHVFLRQEFEVVASELDTVPDLLSYLAIRDKLLSGGILPPWTGELDLLMAYATRYDILDSAIKSGDQGIVIEQDMWRETLERHRGLFASRQRRRERSRIFDEIVAALHTSIGFKPELDADQAPKEHGEGTEENYWRLVRALGAFRRQHRVSVSEKILEKVQLAQTKEMSYFQFRSQEGGPWLVFMATALPREERLRRLLFLSELASAASEGAEVVGVGTDAAGTEGRSYDYCYVEGLDPAAIEELKPMAKRFFADPQASAADEWDAAREGES